jgi:hypothetical protein
MSDIQKMMLMMSLGQGFPGFSSSLGASEMEILEDFEEDDYSDLPELVEDDVSEIPVVDVSEIPVVDVSEIPVVDVSEIPVVDVVTETEPIDYHKLDVKTLRQIAQDLYLKENVKNMKKPELIKLLSSQAKI